MESMNGEPQYVATGVTAALTAVPHCNRSYDSMPRLWRFKTNIGSRKPIYATTAREDKCRDKEAKLPKIRGIV